MIFTLTLLANLHLQANAASNLYTVKKGDTYWKIAQAAGVSVYGLKQANHKTSDILYTGQKLVIPEGAVSVEERDLLARLVSAEAVGEPYAGKVAVATVVLNRVDHPDFPNSVKEVIYEKAGGHFAFTPVQNGKINQAADTESKKAVNEAIAFRGQGNGSIFFYNPKTSTSKWIFSRQVIVTIGNHRFAK
ncbi:cell wall hydrolase [Bacillaceae bacterium Marseille-Q3522]|nr:cell wall hydrolase [Bacillaceae bacterium Marseille-Q3522]